jgi:hypothetical protein
MTLPCGTRCEPGVGIDARSMPPSLDHGAKAFQSPYQALDLIAKNLAFDGQAA